MNQKSCIDGKQQLTKNMYQFFVYIINVFITSTKSLTLILDSWLRELFCTKRIAFSIFLALRDSFFEWVRSLSHSRGEGVTFLLNVKGTLKKFRHANWEVDHFWPNVTLTTQNKKIKGSEIWFSTRELWSLKANSPRQFLRNKMLSTIIIKL